MDEHLERVDAAEAPSGGHSGEGPLQQDCLQSWLRGGVIYGVLAVITSLIMWDAVKAISHIAMTSNTFGHILLIPLVVGWLVWNRLPELKHIKPSPAPWAGGLLAGSGFLWLLGKAADIQLAQQLAYVLSLQILVLTVFGRKGLYALLFPTIFMIFLVPFGEEFVPTLQNITAKIVIWGLNLLGIPVYTDGVFLQTPSGDFEVAEACSGIRFMVSTFALGALFSVLCFKSWKRRVLVVLLSILIPIIANGIRAFGIVYIAYLTDNTVAVGVDHLIYGWIFFAIVTVLLIAVGLTFSDRSVQDPPISIEEINALSPDAGGYDVGRVKLLKLIGIPVSTLGVFFLLNAWMDSRQPDLALQPYTVAPAPLGWTYRAESLGDRWLPNYVGADQTTLHHYSDGERFVSLYRAGYGYQRQGAELIGFGNTAAAPEDIWGWARSAGRTVNFGGQQTKVQYVMLRGNSGVLRDAWQLYLVNGKLVTSPVRAKIETILARLTGGPLYTATLVLSAPRFGAGDTVGGEELLKGFAAQLPPPDVLLQQLKQEGR